MQAAVARCAAATAIAERFGDADLFALTVHTQGQMLVAAPAASRRGSGCSTRRWSR